MFLKLSQYFTVFVNYQHTIIEVDYSASFYFVDEKQLHGRTKS